MGCGASAKHVKEDGNAAGDGSAGDGTAAAAGAGADVVKAPAYSDAPDASGVDQLAEDTDAPLEPELRAGSCSPSASFALAQARRSGSPPPNLAGLPTAAGAVPDRAAQGSHFNSLPAPEALTGEDAAQSLLDCLHLSPSASVKSSGGAGAALKRGASESVDQDLCGEFSDAGDSVDEELIKDMMKAMGEDLLDRAGTLQEQALRQQSSPTRAALWHAQGAADDAAAAAAAAVMVGYESPPPTVALPFVGTSGTAVVSLDAWSFGAVAGGLDNSWGSQLQPGDSGAGDAVSAAVAVEGSSGGGFSAAAPVPRASGVFDDITPAGLDPNSDDIDSDDEKLMREILDV